MSAIFGYYTYYCCVNPTTRAHNRAIFSESRCKLLSILILIYNNVSASSFKLAEKLFFWRRFAVTGYGRLTVGHISYIIILCWPESPDVLKIKTSIISGHNHRYSHFSFEKNKKTKTKEQKSRFRTTPVGRFNNKKKKQLQLLFSENYLLTNFKFMNNSLNNL